MESTVGMLAAHEHKRDAVLQALEFEGHDAVLLTSPAALSWYLEGARVGVNRAGDPVLAVRVSREGDRLLVFANEADRIIAEELPSGLDPEIERVPWFEPITAAAAPEAAIADALRAARRRLHPHEIESYRRLGADAAVAVTDAIADVDPASTEFALGGGVAGRLEAAGIETHVVLVAGADRLHHRHPLPTTAPIGRRTMVVVSARRRGLIINLTRWFGEEPTSDELDLEQRIARVEAATFAATVPGATLAEILSTIAEAYRAEGFDRDEWLNHHQGGPTGFAGRDPRATPQARETVAEFQAFAWNPTAPGAKIEDTVLRTPEGFEVLTVDERWPTHVVDGLARPVTLVR